MANLKEKYVKELAPKLQEKLGLTNKMLIPRLQKVVLNMAFGIVEKDVQKHILDDLTKITAQKPMLCKARKSISNFKLRENMPIGAKVTLRGDKMYEFLDRLTAIAMPRVRDFKGISDTGFDGRGNYTFGVKEQIIFPEISIEKVNKITGMDITFVTSTNSDEEGYELLKALGMPFANANNKG